MAYKNIVVKPSDNEPGSVAVYDCLFDTDADNSQSTISLKTSQSQSNRYGFTIHKNTLENDVLDVFFISNISVNGETYSIEAPVALYVEDRDVLRSNNPLKDQVLSCNFPVGITGLILRRNGVADSGNIFAKVIINKLKI